MKYIVVFNVKFPIFNPTATKFEFSQQLYIKVPNITISLKTVPWKHVDGRTA